MRDSGTVSIGNATGLGAAATANVVMTGDGYAGIMERYADLTGHPPVLPEWAAGFWQCKLRYKTQDELLTVAREHKRRGLPMSVIVIDTVPSAAAPENCTGSDIGRMRDAVVRSSPRRHITADT